MPQSVSFKMYQERLKKRHRQAKEYLNEILSHLCPELPGEPKYDYDTELFISGEDDDPGYEFVLMACVYEEAVKLADYVRSLRRENPPGDQLTFSRAPQWDSRAYAVNPRYSTSLQP